MITGCRALDIEFDLLRAAIRIGHVPASHSITNLSPKRHTQKRTPASGAFESDEQTYMIGFAQVAN
jgi:hypothetical protein